MQFDGTTIEHEMRELVGSRAWGKLPSALTDWLEARYAALQGPPEQTLLIDAAMFQRTVRDLLAGESVNGILNAVAKHENRLGRPVAVLSY